MLLITLVIATIFFMKINCFMLERVCFYILCINCDYNPVINQLIIRSPLLSTFVLKKIALKLTILVLFIVNKIFYFYKLQL